MTPTVTNSHELATTLFIFFLCIVGGYLSVQLSKAKKQSEKHYLRSLAERTAAQIQIAEAGTIKREELITAAKYGYNYHRSTQFKLMSFEKNCLENFLLTLDNKVLRKYV